MPRRHPKTPALPPRAALRHLPRLVRAWLATVQPTLAPLTVALLLAILLPGCAEEFQPHPFSVRDSAGVQIVLNGTGAPLPVRHLGDPVVEIGRLEGDVPYLLHRVVNATLLADGSVAILDGSAEVRLFDAEGTWVRSFGGEGDGPGELRRPQHLWPVGDSIAVYQGAGARLTVFPLDGSAPRVATPPTDAGAAFLSAWHLGPAPVIPQRSTTSLGQRLAEATHAGNAVSLTYTRLAPDGGPPDTLTTIANGTEHRMEFTVAGRTLATMSQPMLQGSAQAAGGAERFHVGQGMRPAVAVHDITGRRFREIQWDTTAVPVTTAVREHYIAATADRIVASAEDMARFPFADSLPHFDRLATDSDGGLWVRRFALAPDTLVQRWMVFDTAGVRTAAAELPAGFRLFQPAGRRVLGLVADSLGVQRVVVAPLVDAGG
ncbi:MAG: hypothetical protein WEB88_05995 [Gemmatimonadota bacterium]